MSKLVFLFTLKPIIYGFIGMLVSGLCFPLAGVIILRNNLVPMRYMLMHGVLLGGMQNGGGKGRKVRRARSVCGGIRRRSIRLQRR